MTPLPAQRPRSDRAFERLYRKHVGDVYRYALAVMRNPADAEDVTQTTFLNAYRSYVEKGSRPEKPQNWLIAIAHNVCRQRFRQSARRPAEVSFEDDIADSIPDDDTPTGDDIRRALGHLAFNQRAALVMRELEGRSYVEIAEILELSTSAVETLIFRARRALREQLEGSLTCGEAELAISRQLDGRLPRVCNICEAPAGAAQRPEGSRPRPGSKLARLVLRWRHGSRHRARDQGSSCNHRGAGCRRGGIRGRPSCALAEGAAGGHACTCRRGCCAQRPSACTARAHACCAQRGVGPARRQGRRSRAGSQAEEAARERALTSVEALCGRRKRCGPARQGHPSCASRSGAAIASSGETEAGSEGEEAAAGPLRYQPAPPEQASEVVARNPGSGAYRAFLRRESWFPTGAVCVCGVDALVGSGIGKEAHGNHQSAQRSSRLGRLEVCKAIREEEGSRCRPGDR